MGLDKEMEILKFDNRMREWNLRKGRISKEEVDSYLSGLEDCQNNMIKLELEEDSAFQSDDSVNSNFNSEGLSNSGHNGMGSSFS